MFLQIVTRNVVIDMSTIPGLIDETGNQITRLACQSCYKTK